MIVQSSSLGQHDQQSSSLTKKSDHESNDDDGIARLRRRSPHEDGVPAFVNNKNFKRVLAWAMNRHHALNDNDDYHEDYTLILCKQLVEMSQDMHHRLTTISAIWLEQVI